MTLVARSLSIPPRTSDGVIATRKVVTIVGPQVFWNDAGLPDLTNILNGTSVSEDMRVLLSGAGAATATMAVVTVSGDDAAAVGGYSIPTDDLISSTGDDGAGVMLVRATYMSVDYDSANMAWSTVTIAGADTLPPTEPLIRSVTTPNTTTVDLELFPPVDPVTPAIQADGLANVFLEREIAGQGYSEILNEVVSPGLSLQYAGVNIGSVSPAPTFTQVGADWEIDAAGNVIGGVTDEFGYARDTIVGDFVATVLVKNITGIVGSFSKGGIMARVSDAAGSAHVMCMSMCDPVAGANQYVKAEYRPSTAASTQEFGTKTGGLTNDRYLRMDRIGDTFTCYWWQPSLSDWISMGSQTVAMGTIIEIGLAVSSHDATAEVTVNFEEFAVQNLPIITHTDSGRTQDTTYNYRARASDGTNTGAYGPVRQITTPVVFPPPQDNYEGVLQEMVGYGDFYGVTGGAGRPIRVVTNLNNTGPGSLRQTLADNPNGSWIIFAEGMSGTIPGGSALTGRSNTTIDGRGANITIRGSTSGQSSIINYTSGQTNFVIMYVTTAGGNTPTPAGVDDDGIAIQNGTGGYSPGGNNVERFWMYHVTMRDSEDEVCTTIRCEGKGTIQSCRLFNANQANSTESHEQGYLISHGSNQNNYGWEQVEVKLSFHRNYWFCGDRQPFITVPSRIHMWNDYNRITTGSGHFNPGSGIIHVTSRYNAPPNSANLLSVGCIYDGPVQFIKPTLGAAGAINGNARIVDALLLNGASNATRNTSLVTEPPYSYGAVNSSTALRDQIIAESGWQNVVNPAH